MADRSSSRKPLVLVVADAGTKNLMLLTLLDQWGYRAIDRDDGLKALEFIRETPVDLVLTDVRMPNLDGIEATRRILHHNPAIPVLIMTAFSSVPSAVEALKAGAYDYLIKPLDLDALHLTVQRALEHTRLKQENQELRRQLSRRQVPDLIGHSPAMERLVEMIGLVAPSEATILITGESGTGKGLVARALHANSARRDRPLVEVNCAAIPENLLESELFGHEKGAFTGADKARRGRFAQADGGTLFLDEVGELPLLMQAKLLRVLQEGELQRVGSDSPIAVDVRVLAASNRKLEAMVAAGTLREDLYYRLNVVTVQVPPLRDRVDDIPVLAEHFWRRFAGKNHKPVKGMTPQAMDLLLKYDWPGNVRELENAMERAVILMRGEFIGTAELPLALQPAPGPAADAIMGVATPGAAPAKTGANTAAPGSAIATLAAMERRLILEALATTEQNKSEAARRLGITRRTLKLKLKKYEEES